MSLRTSVPSSPLSRIAALSLSLSWLVLLSACFVTSINPLYEDISPKDPDVVFDKALTGSWTETEEKCTTRLTITSEGEIYRLQSTQKGEGCSDSAASREQARLIKLDHSYFLDMSPITENVCDMCLPIHQIVMLKLGKDTLYFVLIDSNGLKAALIAKKVVLPTLPDHPDTLTASSKDLKNFFRTFADDKTVFNPDTAVVFTRQ